MGVWGVGVGYVGMGWGRTHRQGVGADSEGRVSEGNEWGLNADEGRICLLHRPLERDEREAADKEGRVGSFVGVRARVVDDELVFVLRVLEQCLELSDEAGHAPKIQWAEIREEGLVYEHFVRADVDSVVDLRGGGSR